MNSIQMTPILRSINLHRVPLLLITTLTLLGSNHCSIPNKMEPQPQPEPTEDSWQVLQHVSFERYVYQYGYRSEPGEAQAFSFRILQNNTLILEESASEHTELVDLNTQDYLSEPASEPELHDLNQDGDPELIVQVYSGGAHCCYTYRIYTLGDTLREIARLDTLDSPLIFEDTDQDGAYEARGVDKTFAYWQTAYAFSPAPVFILTFTPQGLEPDLEKMRKPAPNESDLETTVMRVRSELGKNISEHQDEAWRDIGMPTVMWGTMLDLIYTGNGDVAWDFFNRVLRTNVRGKKEFRAAFEEVLQASPYWEGIRQLNGW